MTFWDWIKSWFKTPEKAKVIPLPKVNESKPEPVKEVKVDRNEDDEPDRPSSDEKGKGLRWIPFAIIHEKRMKTKGKYKEGYPSGAVIHFTAGHSKKGLDNAKNTISGGIKNGYVFLCIATDGSVVQAHPIDEWGYHCGESKWPGLGSSLSNKLVGIEINNAGRLEKIGEGKYKSWFGEIYTESQVRHVKDEEHGMPGTYPKFTDEQEEALFNLLKWLKDNDPTGKTFKFDYCLGHHEVSGKKGLGRWRKNDPSGAHSLPMSKLREALKK
jgi:N-acetyl-anhydromuramyl-L-alanine amidase AmpD